MKRTANTTEITYKQFKAFAEMIDETQNFFATLDFKDENEITAEEYLQNSLQAVEDWHEKLLQVVGEENEDMIDELYNNSFELGLKLGYLHTLLQSGLITVNYDNNIF